MLKPRKSLIGLESTSDYHCISRCVRRAFLCGEDAYTGRSFEHRRGWIEGRLLELAQIFAIEVCGYSLIATHSHRVLHVDQPLAESWTAREVVERWHQLFSGTELSERYLREGSLLEVEQQQLEDLAETWRERLTSVSWLLTHRAAQRAHRPQGRRGGCVHRALLGGAVSVLRLSDTCVRKYHLDGVLIPGPARRPSRARLSRLRGPQPGACRHRRDPRGLRLHLDSATDSHTTGRLRAQRDDLGVPRQSSRLHQPPPTQPPELYPFVGGVREAMPEGLPFHLADYLELVNWTGRAVREDKRGASLKTRQDSCRPPAKLIVTKHSFLFLL